MVLNSINWYSLLETGSKILGMIAAVIIAIGIIHTKVVAPWIAKPVAKAVKNELIDAVEAIILSDLIQDGLKETIEEHVTHEMRQILAILHEHDERLIRIENAAGFLVSKASKD